MSKSDSVLSVREIPQTDFSDSLNEAVHASPPGGLGYVLAPVALPSEAMLRQLRCRRAPALPENIPTLVAPAHFLRPETATRFLYRAQKNVANSGTLCTISAELFWKVLTKESK
jgi:hypothetical protein